MGLGGCGLAHVAASQPLEAPRPALAPTAESLRMQRYEQALALMAAGALSDARAQLIELIDQSPGWPAPWLELALVSIRLGAPEEAEEFLQALLIQFAPLPLAVQQKVDALQSQLRELPHGPLKVQAGEAKGTTSSAPEPIEPGRKTARLDARTFVGLGFEQNPNAGIRPGAVLLTLPGGEQWFDVAASSRPDPSAFARLGLRVMAHSAHAWGELRAGATMQAKQLERARAADTRELATELAYDPMRGPWAVALTAQVVHVSNRLAYQGAGLSLAVRPDARLPIGKCSLGGALDLERRQYPSNALLEGDWHAMRLDYSCATATHGRWLTYLQRGLDRAQQHRPGGDTAQLSVGLLRQSLPLGAQGVYRWQLHAELSRADDAQPYSALLDYGAPRDLQRAQLALSWSVALPPLKNTWLTLSGRALHQKSNLALFEMGNFSLESTIWRAW